MGTVLLFSSVYADARPRLADLAPRSHTAPLAMRYRHIPGGCPWHTNPSENRRKTVPITRLESALTQVFILKSLKSFGIHTYKNPGEGVLLLTSATQLLNAAEDSRWMERSVYSLLTTHYSLVFYFFCP
jgi:hypothetical protein